MPEEDLLELKFRLLDGSDMGPFRYSPASTVAMLKERIVAEWPKDKKGGPKSANDIKLINAGKIFGEQQNCWAVQNTFWGASERSNYYARCYTNVFNESKNRKEDR